MKPGRTRRFSRVGGSPPYERGAATLHWIFHEENIKGWICELHNFTSTIAGILRTFYFGGGGCGGDGGCILAGHTHTHTFSQFYTTPS